MMFKSMKFWIHVDILQVSRVTAFKVELNWPSFERMEMMSCRGTLFLKIGKKTDLSILFFLASGSSSSLSVQSLRSLMYTSNPLYDGLKVLES